MIPQRTLAGIGFGNGLRIRVTACRKRLRVARAAHRTAVTLQVDEPSTTQVTNDDNRASHGPAGAPKSSLQEEADRT